MRGKRFYLVGYRIAASALVTLTMLIQSYKYEIFGTTLLLGWDSPAYVWMAKYVIDRGPLNMVHMWSYPNLYVHLLAFFGYLTGNLVMIERILPILFGFILIRVKETFTWEDKINQYLRLYENNMSQKRSSFGLSSDEKKCYRDYLTKTCNEGNLVKGRRIEIVEG